jgi:hypothetical protein
MIGKWPRFCELGLALWLIASPWILDQPIPPGYRIVAFAAGALIVMLDVLAIAGRFLYGHLVILLVCLGLGGFAILGLPPMSQAAQSLVVTCLLLAILAILPTEATSPPRSWREFERRASRR